MAHDLVSPLFVIDGHKKRESIPSLPGHARLSIDFLIQEAQELWRLGIPCVALFPSLKESLKNEKASEATNPKSFYQKAIGELKAHLPNLMVMTDVALDPYSSDGHDGLVCPQKGEVLNDQTLEILGEMAVLQASSGSDIIAPSDMMDGRVKHIRDMLDRGGFIQTSIMSYTAKYASAFYGPFREALGSAPKKGDKKTYQMDFSNGREALREAKLDEEEGADILMVKPGLPYLDVLTKIRSRTHLPLAVYQVSGEYAMAKAAISKKWLDNDSVMVEMLTAFKRAGADIIITYFAKEMAAHLERLGRKEF